ncbi:MAG: RNA polymerase subunit sigma [Syntrophus sp. (in: bacteria)]|nr:RNA polymerase subunit sigma [Syntrophus sp. (in: bacteria)]
MEDYKKVAGLIKERGYAVAFTGAGISVDSGIPAFRGGQGLWEKYDPMEYAHIGAFHSNPGKVWIMLRDMSRVIFESKPSPAHKALSDLESMGYLKAIITQNVDGLHQIAGNSNIIEYHGNHWQLVCLNCATRVALAPEVVSAMPYPMCDRCMLPLKPDVVFFGEGIPMKAMIRANEEANNCKVLIIIGTSGVVYPAAEIPYMAKSNGAVIVEINMDPSPFTSSITDHFFKGSASDVLPEIMGYF